MPFNVSFEKKITLGQVVTALIFVLGVAVTMGSTMKDVNQQGKILSEHIQSVEAVKEQFVRKDQFISELSALHRELADLKLIAYSNMTGRKLTIEETKRILESINGQ